MNLNNFTTKSQEAIQKSQQIAQSFGHQQIENEHLFKAILEVDENVTPFILKKLNVNVLLLQQILVHAKTMSALARREPHTPNQKLPAPK